MYRNARRAYESASKTSTSSRDLEATALFKAARMLEACRSDWDGPERPARLTEALNHNLRLWTLFQTELSQPDCPLDRELRVNLLRLSAFIDRRTFEIMSRPEPQKLQALIDINRNIAAGLSQQAPGAEGPGSQAA